jgi:hypothetical protein
MSPEYGPPKRENYATVLEVIKNVIK